MSPGDGHRKARGAAPSENAAPDRQRRRLLRAAAWAWPTLFATTASRVLAAVPRIDVRVNREVSIQTLDSTFAGLSYEKSHLSSGLFSAADDSLRALFTRLGPSLLRLGGNSVDRTRWVPQGERRPDQVSRSDIAGLAAVLRATQWQVLYGLNFATNTPELIGEEAGFASTALGDRLYGFEIGNECDLYRYNGLRAPDYRYRDFLAQWRDLRAAIVARVPGARLTGPASSFDAAGYTLPFARDEGASLKLLTQHYYRADGLDPGSNMELLLSPDPSLAGRLRELVEAARTQRISDGVRIAEANSFYHEGSAGVSDAYGSALWLIDFLFECALAGCRGVNLHGGGLTKSYTPLADNGERVIAVRPEYEALLLFSLAARGMLVTTSINPSRSRFSAHAVLGNDRSTAVVIVNSDPKQAIELWIDFGVPATRLSTIELTGPSLNAHERVELGGAAVDSDGQWNPATARMLEPEASGRAQLTVSAHSAVLVRAF